jgi:hypothetical protein
MVGHLAVTEEDIDRPEQDAGGEEQDHHQSDEHARVQQRKLDPQHGALAVEQTSQGFG